MQHLIRYDHDKHRHLVLGSEERRAVLLIKQGNSQPERLELAILEVGGIERYLDRYPEGTTFELVLETSTSVLNGTVLNPPQDPTLCAPKETVEGHSEDKKG